MTKVAITDGMKNIKETVAVLPCLIAEFRGTRRDFTGRYCHWKC